MARRRRVGFFRKHFLSVALVLAAAGMVGYDYHLEVKRHNSHIDKTARQTKRQKDLIINMYKTVRKNLDLDSTPICAGNDGPYVPAASPCNFLLVHGYDSEPHLMRALKNDMRAWKTMVTRQGCQPVEICSDVHDRSQLEIALEQLADNSDPNGITGQFYTAHGLRNNGKGEIQFRSGSSEGTKKGSGDSSSTITAEDLGLHLERIRGIKEVFVDMCYALPDLEGVTQYDSSAPNHVSYFLPHHETGDGSHVEMSYFTLAVSYSMVRRGNRYTIAETVEHMSTRDRSLPTEVIQLMVDHPEAFKSITIRENSRPITVAYTGADLLMRKERNN